MRDRQLVDGALLRVVRLVQRSKHGHILTKLPASTGPEAPESVGAFCGFELHVQQQRHVMMSGVCAHELSGQPDGLAKLQLQRSRAGRV